MPFEDQYSMPNIQDDILRWIAQNDARQHIETLRAQLTPLENHIFDEYFVHEKAASQIAAEQDCPASSVYGTIQRIRKNALKLLCSLLFSLGSLICCFQAVYKGKEAVHYVIRWSILLY